MKKSEPLSGIDHDYRIELIRKAIHFCSLSIPIFYFYTPKTLALAICVPITLAFLIVDVARYYHHQTEVWFYKTFGWLLRKHESDQAAKRLNGATYVLIAATLSILIFPKLIAVTSFMILIISDMTSALVGRRFGRTPFLGKSLEGSTAFFLSALLVVAVTPKVEHAAGEYLVGAFAAGIGAILEALPQQIDDNLTVPIGVGASLWASYLLFLPSLDLYKFG